MGGEIWTTEEKESIWFLVLPLCYSYQSPQSHKTHPLTGCSLAKAGSLISQHLRQRVFLGS